MSRGLGCVERAILAALETPDAYGLHGRSTRTLAVQLYGQHPTLGQRTAMHRAVSSLARKGLVTIRRTLGRKRCVRLVGGAAASPATAAGVVQDRVSQS